MRKRSYRVGAKVLGLGVGLSGLITFAFFALASHSLEPVAYKRVALLWSMAFIIVTVIYRPIEQLLSRTIAERGGAPSLKTPLAIQGLFALIFLGLAIAFRHKIQDDAFDGSSGLYLILLIAVMAYAASYFARGWLAGHGRFELYSGLVTLESTSRFLFVLAVALGVSHGQVAVAFGIAAAPLLSLAVVPWGIASQRTPDSGVPRLRRRHAAKFAGAVLAIQFAEQAMINAPVIVTEVVTPASEGALAGYVFNVLLITRAPLVLFQAIQTTLLPYIAGGGDEKKVIRATVGLVTVFAGAVSLSLLAVGPTVMHAVFGPGGEYARLGLTLVGLGMGFHLVAGTLNQAALARRHSAQAAAAWALVALLFLGWVAAPVMPDLLMRVEVGYFGAAAILCALLSALYRRISSEPIVGPAADVVEPLTTPASPNGANRAPVGRV